ncbi:MAG TPA: hypothetical protein VMV20_04505, partial [Chitinophagaceae bacterium]|nr:hypothetical protein [Chitinophagaceae bacterium]
MPTELRRPGLAAQKYQRFRIISVNPSGAEESSHSDLDNWMHPMKKIKYFYNTQSLKYEKL